jgi:hypothetical protein
MKRYLATLVVGMLIGTALAASPSQALPNCERPKAVPRSKLPRDVKLWAHGQPAFGHGSIWALRSNIPTQSERWQHDDGQYGLKFPWYLSPAKGDVPTITGRRVDGPGTFGARANAAFSGTTWVSSGLQFSAPGCWEVTGEYGGDTLTFRVHVRA